MLSDNIDIGLVRVGMNVMSELYLLLIFEVLKFFYTFIFIVLWGRLYD